MKRTVLSIITMLVLVAAPTAALAKSQGQHGGHGKSGTIKSYDAATGDLTITTNKGRDITAAVTNDTRIQCDANFDDNTATTSSHGGGDDNGGDDGANHDAGDDNGDDPANHDAGDDNGDHQDNGRHGGNCSTNDLTAGTDVRRARIDLGDDAVWTKLKLVG
jgi:hypothetical protein